MGEVHKNIQICLQDSTDKRTNLSICNHKNERVNVVNYN